MKWALKYQLLPRDNLRQELKFIFKIIKGIKWALKHQPLPRDNLHRALKIVVNNIILLEKSALRAGVVFCKIA